jgi:hypothetical protein
VGPINDFETAKKLSTYPGIVAEWLIPDRSSRTPHDPNQIAKLVVDSSTGAKEAEPPPTKSSAAVELGRLGGLKGGKARAKKLSPKKRSRIARMAARARWRAERLRRKDAS